MPEEDVSLLKLVKLSIGKVTLPKQFVILYNQLNERRPVSDSEFIGLLNLKHDTKNLQSLRLDYVIAVSLSNDENFSRFWKLLAKIDVRDQIAYLIRFSKKLHEKVNLPANNLLKNNLVDSFAMYATDVLNSLTSEAVSASQLSLLNHIVFFVGAITNKKSLAPTKLDVFKPFVAQLIKKLNDYGLDNLVRYFTIKISSVMDFNEISNGKTDSLQPSSTTTQSLSYGQASIQHVVKNLSTINPNSNKTMEYIRLKKYLWLHNTMKQWRFRSKQQFYSQFDKLFGQYIKIANNSHGYAYGYDLVQNLLHGYIISVKNNDLLYILFNWRNFVVVVLPGILSFLKFPPKSSEGNESLDDVLINVFGSFSEDQQRELGDLAKDLAKSLLLSQQVSFSTYQKLFPEDTYTEAALSNARRNVIPSIENELNIKLLEVNLEFTSIEESGLLDYINLLPSLLKFLEPKQAELNRVVQKIVDQLVAERDTEKLSRLVLALLNNIEVLNLMFFNEQEDATVGPWVLLNKLINFIDDEKFSVDDDDNFQESYSHFGVILLGMILIISKFNINLSNFEVADSYSVDYINNFYYRLCDDLTNVVESTDEEDTTIVTNYNNLLSEWINSLFDDSNDGLSDDLIKSVNIKQIFKIIPLIYQQAIIALEGGSINQEIFNNGVDYLSQLFLVPCTVMIFQWVLSRIKIEIVNQQGECESNDICISVLHEILKSNLGGDNEESSLVFSVVLQIVGPSLLALVKRFTNWDKHETAKKVVEAVEGKIDKHEAVNHQLSLISSDNNLMDQAKEIFTEGLNNDEAGKRDAAYGFFATSASYFDANDEIRYLLQEIEVYQDLGLSEDNKLFNNLLVFLVVQESVVTTDLKKYWQQQICTRTNQTPEVFVGDQGFALSMENHYSNIFNDPGPRKKAEGNDDEDDDDDDDDLFNENPKLSSTKNISVVSKYINLQPYQSSLKEFADLYRNLDAASTHQDCSRLVKSMHILKARFLHEMSQI